MTEADKSPEYKEVGDAKPEEPGDTEEDVRRCSDSRRNERSGGNDVSEDDNGESYPQSDVRYRLGSNSFSGDGIDDGVLRPTAGGYEGEELAENCVHARDPTVKESHKCYSYV